MSQKDKIVRRYLSGGEKIIAIILALVIWGFSFQEGAIAFPDEPLSDWKEYKNDEYGYQLKFPEGWKVVEAKPRGGKKAMWAGNILLEGELQKVTFLERERSSWQGEFQVIVYSNPKRFTAEQWIEQNEPQDVTGGSLVQEISETTLDGVPAMEMSIFGFDHEEIGIIASYNGHIYSISFAGRNPNDAEVERHQRLYEHMLSSFRFVR